MLRTEHNTPRVRRDIIRAAVATLGRRRFQVDYEHGQHWVTDLRSGAQWSAIDSTDPHGFSFEQVSQGDEDE